MNTVLIAEPVSSLLRRARSGRPGWLSLALALLLLRSTPAAAEPRDATEVQGYERRYNVTPEEAERRLGVQARAAGIVEDLQAVLGPNYAGLWFDNQTGEFVVPVSSPVSGSATSESSYSDNGSVLATERRDIDSRFNDYGINEGSYRITPVRSSYTDLKAGQERVNQALRPLFEEGLAKTGLSAKTNAVWVHLVS